LAGRIKLRKVILKVYLVRHGTIDNPQDIMYARLPGFHLNNEGKQQAKKIAEKLKNQKITRIYTSSLERAWETAQIIAKILGVDDIQKSDDLIDADFKNWQGKPNKDVFSKSDWCKDRINCADVEPITHSGQRIIDFIQDNIQPDGNAIIVSHGDPINGAWAMISGQLNKVKKLGTKHIVRKGDFIRIDINNGKWKVAPKNQV
jgi:broad specificity phosphatase PhoE